MVIVRFDTLTNNSWSFDIDSITGLDRGVQQCQMYMAMTLIWNQALIQGRRQRRLIKENKWKNKTSNASWR